MENEIVRKHFISAVLDIPLERIKTIRIINPFLWKRYQKQKLGILDLQLILNDNTKINIELQLRPQTYWEKKDHFLFRKDVYCGFKAWGSLQKSKEMYCENNIGF